MSTEASTPADLAALLDGEPAGEAEEALLGLLGDEWEEVYPPAAQEELRSRLDAAGWPAPFARCPECQTVFLRRFRPDSGRCRECAALLEARAWRPAEAPPALPSPTQTLGGEAQPPDAAWSLANERLRRGPLWEEETDFLALREQERIEEAVRAQAADWLGGGGPDPSDEALPLPAAPPPPALASGQEPAEEAALVAPAEAAPAEAALAEPASGEIPAETAASAETLEGPLDEAAPALEAAPSETFAGTAPAQAASTEAVAESTPNEGPPAELAESTPAEAETTAEAESPEVADAEAGQVASGDLAAAEACPSLSDALPEARAAAQLDSSDLVQPSAEPRAATEADALAASTAADPEHEEAAASDADPGEGPSEAAPSAEPELAPALSSPSDASLEDTAASTPAPVSAEQAIADVGASPADASLSTGALAEGEAAPADRALAPASEGLAAQDPPAAPAATPALRPAGPAELREETGRRAGRVHTLALGSSFRIGTARRGEVVLRQRGVAFKHAEVAVDAEGRATLTDLGVGQTWIGEEQLAAHESRPLASGDLVRCGEARLSVTLHLAEAPPVPAPAPLETQPPPQARWTPPTAAEVAAARHTPPSQILQALPASQLDLVARAARAIPLPRWRAEQPRAERVFVDQEAEAFAQLARGVLDGRYLPDDSGTWLRWEEDEGSFLCRSALEDGATVILAPWDLLARLPEPLPGSGPARVGRFLELLLPRSTGRLVAEKEGDLGGGFWRCRYSSRAGLCQGRFSSIEARSNGHVLAATLTPRFPLQTLPPAFAEDPTDLALGDLRRREVWRPPPRGHGAPAPAVPRGGRQRDRHLPRRSRARDR